MKLSNSLEFLGQCRVQHPSGLGSKGLCAIQERNHAQAKAGTSILRSHHPRHPTSAVRFV